jgi:LPXTG-site transpeptidase (sortase) family protein
VSRHRRRGTLVTILATAGAALVLLGAFAVADQDALSNDRAEQRTAAASPSAPGVSTPLIVEPVTRLRRAVRVADPAQGVPTEVWIPRLQVRVPVVPIAAEGGTLVPPDDPQLLGWWRDGAEPGALNGGAVITGHTVHTGGGALDRLKTLRVDDRVVVRTGRGRIAYDVRVVTDLSKDELAERAAEVFSAKVPGRLVLITCTDWDGSAYLSNTVVFADPAHG